MWPDKTEGVTQKYLICRTINKQINRDNFKVKNNLNSLLIVWEKKNHLCHSDRASFSSFLVVYTEISGVQATCLKFSATVNYSVMYLDNIQCALLTVTHLSIQVWMQYLM